MPANSHRDVAKLVAAETADGDAALKRPQHAAMKADVMQSIQIFGSSGRAQAALAA